PSSPCVRRPRRSGGTNRPGGAPVVAAVSAAFRTRRAPGRTANTVSLWTPAFVVPLLGAALSEHAGNERRKNLRVQLHVNATDRTPRAGLGADHGVVDADKPRGLETHSPAAEAAPESVVVVHGLWMPG